MLTASPPGRTAATTVITMIARRRWRVNARASAMPTRARPEHDHRQLEHDPSRNQQRCRKRQVLIGAQLHGEGGAAETEQERQRRRQHDHIGECHPPTNRADNTPAVAIIRRREGVESAGAAKA